ncbi:MAG: hypothetical protein C4532_05510 [Candidatus Abyssobacteria bacterium SURF_17]|uniref:ParB-like N-terminal domain-containing protein n=1 Tax=Candidatus Abyssobacteria bacterium SURF_17 TaxID=2093361 RepID=A0A419F377_9BACT|nr:MAG: hypothetical protein C4532_05510 [Candidatus Abyssubacteria bacterium SURF_17]
MYEKLPIELLEPHPNNANRISKMFAKKLRHNIEQLGMYETLTVRPHPRENGKFEILNGNARIEALRALGASNVKCEIWKVSDSEAQLFLALLNRLRGSDVAELRMNLLFDLLREYPKEYLAAHIPETVPYLTRLESLGEEPEKAHEELQALGTDIVIVNYYLTAEQHRVVTTALDTVSQRFGLSDSSEALAKLASLYLEQVT